jgi:hypothetical protein
MIRDSRGTKPNMQYILDRYWICRVLQDEYLVETALPKRLSLPAAATGILRSSATISRAIEYRDFAV